MHGNCRNFALAEGNGGYIQTNTPGEMADPGGKARQALFSRSPSTHKSKLERKDMIQTCITMPQDNNDFEGESTDIKLK